MSASTGAAFTTPLDANARRRTTVIEKKSVETFSERGIDANGNDLSHTIRGDTVLEGLRDLTQTRKRLIHSSISPRRRKHLPKPEKPRWQTVVSILIKNLLLLAVLLWLLQMAFQLRYGFGNDHSGSRLAAFDHDARISRVEDSMKSAAKMFQIQLDILDKKIANEIGAVSSEIGMVTKELRHFEEKNDLFEKGLKNLESRSDSIKKSLDELKGMGLLSKEELERFWVELKKSGSFDGGVKSADLDRIRAFVKGIVEQEISRHAADGLGMVDFALASGGGRVVRHSEPYVSGKANSWLAVVRGRIGVHGNAQKMLEPSFGEPGQCFPLNGSNGFVEIRLRTGIVPEAITLEHVPKTVAYDLSSAPKDCSVSGWFEAPSDNNPTDRSGKVINLAQFSYDLSGPYAQTFNIVEYDAGVAVVNTVRLEFASNHGNPALTCIYRLRVHGREHKPTQV